MPVFFQQQINENTRLGIWKIEEPEEFFKGNVPLHREVTHPMKRLQHLAGRFLLRYLFPDFPYELIRIADTRKPFLPNEAYHFSISHCGDYAAAIVSRENRVGIDIEKPVEKILKVQHKFRGENEIFQIQQALLQQDPLHAHGKDTEILGSTLIWSMKEAVFKWYGDGGVEFKDHIRLLKPDRGHKMNSFFTKTNSPMDIHFRIFSDLVLTWVVT